MSARRLGEPKRNPTPSNPEPSRLRTSWRVTVPATEALGFGPLRPTYSMALVESPKLDVAPGARHAATRLSAGLAGRPRARGKNGAGRMNLCARYESSPTSRPWRLKPGAVSPGVISRARQRPWRSRSGVMDCFVPRVSARGQAAALLAMTVRPSFLNYRRRAGRARLAGSPPAQIMRARRLWLWRCGSRSRPSRAATGNHRASVRGPAAARGPRPSARAACRTR
jgi:hypothetical protein